MTDDQLLAQYLQTRSQYAFSQLVKRHINLVYAAARRQTHNADLADDVTQAVFIVLARRAHKVRSGAALPGWLLGTTRYAASNAIKLEMRRRRHERSAAEMAQLQTDPNEDATDVQIAATLDQAMMRLGRDDRSAVAMRYFQGMSLSEVGASFGISPEAAQKRVSRALLRLRDYFAARGVDLESAALATRLSKTSASVAPAALLPLITAAAMKTAPAGATSVAIANGVLKSLFWAPAKLATAACVAVALVAGTGAVVASRGEASRTPPTAGKYDANSMWTPYVAVDSPGISTVTFANGLFGNSGPAGYEVGLDPNVMRTPGTMAAHVRTLDRSFPAGVVFMRINAPSVASYRGKRIRLRAYIKSESVEREAGLNLIVFGPNGRVDAQDDMSDRPIVGTTDWKLYESVADVPADAEQIVPGTVMKGAGALWWDSVELSVVGEEVPITDDRRWHIFGETPGNYTASLDTKELRDGKPTILISSETAGPKEWVLYDHLDRSPQPLLGKRVKMSAMIKSENSDGCRLSMRSVGPMFKTIAQDEGYGLRAAKGSMGWLRYSIYLNVAPETHAISSGIAVYGKGKVWIDDVKYEILGDAPRNASGALTQ